MWLFYCYSLLDTSMINQKEESECFEPLFAFHCVHVQASQSARECRSPRQRVMHLQHFTVFHM